MDKEEFKQKRIEGRKELLEKIIEIFKKLNPVAIHQFGSGASGYKDEFSDIDIWVTFKDDQIDEIVKQREKIFKSIGSILIKHESKTNSPLGGSATLILYNNADGIYQVDFYISKVSETVILKDARVLYGSDSFPRGEWKLSPGLKERKGLGRMMNFLIVMSFILTKGVIRKWERGDLEEIIKKAYMMVQEKSGTTLKQLPGKISFKLIYNILENLYPLANNKQRQAITKIKDFAKEVQKLYKF